MKTDAKSTRSIADKIFVQVSVLCIPTKTKEDSIFFVVNIFLSEFQFF